MALDGLLADEQRRRHLAVGARPWATSSATSRSRALNVPEPIAGRADTTAASDSRPRTARVSAREAGSAATGSSCPPEPCSGHGRRARGPRRTALGCARPRSASGERRCGWPRRRRRPPCPRRALPLATNVSQVQLVDQHQDVDVGLVGVVAARLGAEEPHVAQPRPEHGAEPATNAVTHPRSCSDSRARATAARVEETTATTIAVGDRRSARPRRLLSAGHLRPAGAEDP